MNVCCLFVGPFFNDSHTIGPYEPKFGIGPELDLKQVKIIVMGPKELCRGASQYWPIGFFGVKEASLGKSHKSDPMKYLLNPLVK